MNVVLFSILLYKKNRHVSHNQHIYFIEQRVLNSYTEKKKNNNI